MINASNANFDIVAIYNKENPHSIEAVERCQRSFNDNGYEIKISNGIWRDQYKDFLKETGLTFDDYDKKYSKHESVVACFGSHFKIWKTISKPTIILEHDAILTNRESLAHFINTYSELYINQAIISNLGAPSFGRFTTKDAPGLYPSFSKNGRYFPGAHGYAISAKAAKIITSHAVNFGAKPTDLFFDLE